MKLKAAASLKAAAAKGCLKGLSTHAGLLSAAGPNTPNHLKDGQFSYEGLPCE